MQYKLEHIYRKRSDCSHCISSYIAVDSILQDAAGKLMHDQISDDIEQLDENAKCTMKYYCLQMLQIPLLAEYGISQYTVHMNKELNDKNSINTIPTFLIDIWYSCATNTIKVVKMSEKTFIAVSYCWDSWGEQFCTNIKKTANDLNLYNAPYEVVLEKHADIILMLSKNRCAQYYIKMLNILSHSCYERYAWIDALCIPQYNENVIASELKNMGIYYSNCELCCIFLGKESNIISDINKGNMPIWFTRAWTYQEYMLSKKCTYVIERKDGKKVVISNVASLYGYLVDTCIVQKNASDITNMDIACIVKALLSICYQLTCKNESNGWDLTGAFSEVGNRSCKEINDKLNSIYGLFGINNISSVPSEPLEKAIKKLIYNIPATSIGKLINIDPRSNNFTGMYWFPLLSNTTEFYVGGQLVDNCTFIQNVRVTKRGLQAVTPSFIHLGFFDGKQLEILEQQETTYKFISDRRQRLIHIQSAIGDYCGALTFEVLREPCKLYGIITGKTRYQPDKIQYVVTVVKILSSIKLRRKNYKCLRKVGTLMLILNNAAINPEIDVIFI